MGPIAAMDSVFSKYATFQGRASRSEFWWWMLMHAVIMLAAICGDVVYFDPTAEIELNPLRYFSGVWVVLTVIPNIAVTVRRLHDTNSSGLWFLASGIPILNFYYLYLLLRGSDRDDNYFGQPPHGPGSISHIGGDLSLLGMPSGPEAKSNPLAAYAVLRDSKQQPTPEMIALRKQEVRNLYRTRVLGQTLDDDAGMPQV